TFSTYVEGGGIEDFGFDAWAWPIQYAATADVTFDSEGPKQVPHACLSCHGGHFVPTSGVVQGATLLPIDPSLVQVEGDPDQTRHQIQQIDMTILMSNPAPAVAEYLRQLMASTATWQSGAPFVPKGWAQESSLYLNVIKPHCAMCHLATPSLNFLSAGDLTK